MADYAIMTTHKTGSRLDASRENFVQVFLSENDPDLYECPHCAALVLLDAIRDHLNWHSHLGCNHGTLYQ